MPVRISAYSIRIERLDYPTASRFFKRYEHLGDCGLGVWHWGAFVHSSLIAVVSFGTTCFGSTRGAIPTLASEFGLKIYQISRGGTIPTAPRNTPSRVLSLILSEFHRFRGDCLIVAYADRCYNEVGTIYQACNGIYTGLTKPKNQSNYVLGGRRMSGWVIRKKFGSRSMAFLKRIDRKARKIPLSPKYRYYFVQAPPLKRRAVLRALKEYSLPYPKRETERVLPMDVAKLIRSRRA